MEAEGSENKFTVTALETADDGNDDQRSKRVALSSQPSLPLRSIETAPLEDDPNSQNRSKPCPTLDDPDTHSENGRYKTKKRERIDRWEEVGIKTPDIWVCFVPLFAD